MNLITSRWLPVRRGSRTHDLIAPTSLFEPEDPVIALDYPRPDWNAAVTEFLIGLAALAFRPAEAGDWRALWSAPDKAQRFAEALAPFAPAFELLGDGPRAFQDFDTLAAVEENAVAELLIDMPGGGTWFNKRGRTSALCLPYVAAALITLQTYAPTGGRGYRTSMRGGGPLTTLARPSNEASLSLVVLANLPHVEPLPSAPLSDLGAWSAVFPWLAPCQTSERDKLSVNVGDSHELQAFFGTPRRIRLGEVGFHSCALGGPSEQGTITTYRTVNYGVKYEGWRHPLSPYRTDAKAGDLPLHPRAGGATYRDWLGLWANDSTNGNSAAECVRLWRARAVRGRGEQFWIDAFGYAMDNMKPLSWTQARVPAFTFEDSDSAEAFFNTARTLVAAAEEAVRALQFSGKLALFGAWSAKDKSYRVPDTVKTESVEDLGDAFWRETEADFEKQLVSIAEAPGQNREAIVRNWVRVLKNAAITLFEARIGGDEAFAEDPKRLVFAKHGLTLAFTPGGKVGKALELPKAEKKKKDQAA